MENNKDIEKYMDKSGFTKDGYKCGRCGKNPLPEVQKFGLVKAKIIICPYCKTPVLNKLASKSTSVWAKAWSKLKS